jgi:coenzyme F420-reducing hydrogenase alpha subunit
MRSTICGICLVLATLAGAEAQEHGSRARGAVAAEEARENERGLESIADEAAEVGADDDAGLGGDERPAGGMEGVEDEMIDAADSDGCTGAMGATCPGGDN